MFSIHKDQAPEVCIDVSCVERYCFSLEHVGEFKVMHNLQLCYVHILVCINDW
jgi:hypothetical protein